MMDKLTYKDIEDAVTALEDNYFRFIKSNILSGMQVMVRSGNKVYFSPDIKNGEVKLYDLPEFDLDKDLPAPSVTFNDDFYLWKIKN